MQPGGTAARPTSRQVIADGGKVSFEGKTATPPLFDTLVALGFERSLARLDAARASLES